MANKPKKGSVKDKTTSDTVVASKEKSNVNIEEDGKNDKPSTDGVSADVDKV